MDALYLYTIRLAVNHASHPSVAQPSPPSVIPSSVFDIRTWPLQPGDKVPKLERDNLLSLLYHADEQWLDSLRQIDGVNEQRNVIDTVHRQQMIYLDTLLLLHRAICSCTSNTTTTNRRSPPSYSLSPVLITSHHNHQQKRLQEPVLFAAQALHHNYNVRHLELYTEQLKPDADRLLISLELLRKVARAQALQPARAFILATTHLLQTRLDDFMRHWDRFESKLYHCYGHVVFGSSSSHDDQDSLLSQKIASAEMPIMTTTTPTRTYRPLPQELFSDSFTRLLPTTLHRALSQNIISHSMIQDLDPITFIAVPRLAVLSGMVYLNHVSGWSHNDDCFSVWFQSQAEAMRNLKQQVKAVEDRTRQQNTQDHYRALVQNWSALEQALVRGWPRQQQQQQQDPENTNAAAAVPQQHYLHQLPTAYRQIYISVCTIADALLAEENARSFTVILKHLFAHFADTSLATSTTTSPTSSSITTGESVDEEDKQLLTHHGVSERTILDLAI
ncbi:hypothetical protein BDB00DRAFT_878402 [Zychaea mexicana]|uniref:uncharacterized protein n=1 Tax=Zychaea mexicana TaxID=64656 RepID=UPI0022FF34B1|nr:uncharacterized protein BDB00DRAFT_878402 [Zychaea mexicana]KAI9484850.1 hypothetical protein BDB00DRAFT_878402 [Zychaea mexicana]